MSDEQRAFRVSRPARSGEPLPPVSLRRFWGLIRRTKPPTAVFAIALFVGTAATLVGLLVPLIMKNLVDGFSHASFDMSHIPLIAGAFAAQALCAGLSLYLLT